MSDIKTINLSKKGIFAPSKPSLLGKVLPFLLIASFMFANLYSAVQGITSELLAMYGNASGWFLALYLLFLSVLDYLIVLLTLWFYRKVLSFKPYFYLIKTSTFNESFKVWYVVRNIVYGLISLVLFAHPYLHIYLPIVSLILSFMVFILNYFSLAKRIDIMFRHMYFKLLMYPWFVFEGISLVLTLLLGGY